MELFPDSRLVAASEGAVISGWLGSITGVVLIPETLMTIGSTWPSNSRAAASCLVWILYQGSN